MKEATKAVKKKIVKACKNGKVVAADPAAFERLLVGAGAGKEPDFTLTNVDVYPNGIVLMWGTKSAGFGNITFYKKGKKMRCDSETMSKEFVREVLNKLVDTAIFDN